MSDIKKTKYSDGRRNNGALKGVSRGQGRPPKIKEKEISRTFLLNHQKRTVLLCSFCFKESFEIREQL